MGVLGLFANRNDIDIKSSKRSEQDDVTLYTVETN